ncbi:MAG: hypothetical protein WA152_02120 [Microgenomates group bacterium]
MPLRLTSNVGRPVLKNVGSVVLDFDKIIIQVEPHCKATISRDGKNITLLQTGETLGKTSGVPKIGDVYTIEHGLEKLTVTVEEEREYAPDNIYINTDKFSESSDKGRKTTLTVGVLLLVLLVVSVFFGVKQKNDRNFNQKSEAKLSEAISLYDSALGGTMDKNEARKSFINSKEIASTLKSDGYKSEKLDELLKNISDKESEIVGEVRPEIKEFLDLTLQTSGFGGKNMTSSGEDIFVFDETAKNVIKVGIKNKSAKIAANKENISDANAIASYQDRLFLNRSDGIYEVDVISKKVIERDWNDTNLFYSYAANIYLLDKDDKEIYRFAGSNKTFGSKSGWLAPGIEMDFSKVIDMVIDGSIWLLSSTGKVTKLTNGNPQAISLNGIPEPLENPTAIYTNEDNKNVYILEKDKGRIVVLDKTGEFKLQYINDEIKNTKDLVVSETEGKAILLTGAKLLEIDLK